MQYLLTEQEFKEHQDRILSHSALDKLIDALKAVKARTFFEKDELNIYRNLSLQVSIVNDDSGKLTSSLTTWKSDNLYAATGYKYPIEINKLSEKIPLSEWYEYRKKDVLKQNPEVAYYGKGNFFNMEVNAFEEPSLDAEFVIVYYK